MPHLLLIHGAWQGAWAWDKLIPELSKRQLPCTAVDMPGNGCGQDRTPPKEVSLDLYMGFLTKELEKIEGDIVVVGHSSGGIIASQLAENHPDRICAIIYIAGMMLPSGMEYADLVAELQPDHPEMAGIIPYLKWSDDGETSTIIEGAAQKILLQDCPSDIADAAAAKLKRHPQRGRAIKATLTEERFGRIPRAYIEAKLDQSIVPVAQKRMQELVPGAVPFSLDSGHTAQLSQPQALAATIMEAILALQDRQD